MILTCDRSGERLDAFLSRALPEISRSAAQKLAASSQPVVSYPLDCKAYCSSSRMLESSSTM